jgi:hypothetical protein
VTAMVQPSRAVALLEGRKATLEAMVVERHRAAREAAPRATHRASRIAAAAVVV